MLVTRMPQLGPGFRQRLRGLQSTPAGRSMNPTSLKPGGQLPGPHQHLLLPNPRLSQEHPSFRHQGRGPSASRYPQTHGLRTLPHLWEVPLAPH